MALLTTTAVASVRGLPAMAPYGLASIFLYVLPAIVFLVPVSLVAAELASGWDGGIFGWVKAAYGDRMGFVAVWQQWMQNVVWFPAQLAFMAGALAYIVNPSLGSNGVFVGATILVVYWGRDPHLAARAGRDGVRGQQGTHRRHPHSGRDARDHGRASTWPRAAPRSSTPARRAAAGCRPGRASRASS